MKRAGVSEIADSGLKERVSTYFDGNSALYAERYSHEPAGDVLWQRHHALLRLVRELQVARGSRILDLGCGPGLLSADLAAQGYRGVGLDVAPAMIKRARARAAAQGFASRWEYQVGDVEVLPFDNESFDGAICAGVIEYLPRDETFLREVNRVLKPGGFFILCFTNRYGYTVSLSSLIYSIKQVPVLLKVISGIRKVLVGGEYGAMGFDFLPRKHRPAQARRLIDESGFSITRDQYLHFTLLPAPFCALFSKLRAFRGNWMNTLDRTPLRVLGSCYIVASAKCQQV